MIQSNPEISSLTNIIPVKLRTIKYVDKIAHKKSSDKNQSFVIPQGLEPWAPTLKVLCSTN